ncbi:MAG: ATPase [Ignavibacteriae bacterium HGW-Ignavibacteriae-1]|jgi:hypothetical protein|nr:MAG: ATPase [Ignavibacteriae bacterium HGW-Ignavibacteriae-1]
MNPFILSAYRTPEYFCDREEEIERLKSSIENNRNTTIISRRRMGKTGLLMHLQYKLKSKKEITFLYFDIMTTSSLNEFVTLFANSLFSTKVSKIDTIYRTISQIFGAFKPSFTINSMTGESTISLELSNIKESEGSLKAIFDYIASSNKQFVIVIDEFQQIINYPENNFEALLRSYIQHLTNTTFIFSGSRKEILNNMFTSKNRPFYMSSEIMHLEQINKPKYTKFISEKFLNAKMAIDNDCISHILDLVDSHTYYVQLICNRLYSENLKTITIDDVNKTYTKLLVENKFYFESFRNILTDNQWKLLQAIARDKIATEITSKDFLNRNKLGSASSVTTAAKSLLKKEIIIKDKTGYRIDDLLLSSWLEMLYK